MNNRWNNFIKELSNLIFFWCFGVLFFAIFRFSFILFFKDKIVGTVGFSEYWNVFNMGLKFDCSVIAYFLTVPLVCTLVLSFFNKFGVIKKVRKIFQYLFIILSSFICLITFSYFQEYGNQFDGFLFLGMTDDTSAIFNTIIDYYNPVLNTIILIATVLVSSLIFRFFENKTTIYTILVKAKATPLKVALILLTIFLFISCIRGTFWRDNASRRIAAVATDDFLNKTVINPFRSLMYAHKDYCEFSSTDGENPFGEIDLEEKYQAETISQIIEKNVETTTPEERPKQIFLIIMESYDSWPLLEKYKPLHISDNLSNIANKGTHFQNILPSHNGTIHAYATIVTNTPYTGVSLSRFSTMGESYITSIFSQFKKLGYKTNVFYGGPASWQNLGEFSKFHGADKVYSGSDAGGLSKAGNWGIEDEKLFELILENVDPNEYTFNLVLTLSYHPPFDVDIYGAGFPYKTVDDMSDEAKSLFNNGMTLTEMGHLWYSDMALGIFVDQAEKKFENSLFAFTGDHYGRRFLTPTPNLYERSSVPFILYGKNIPDQKLDTPGSHIDIMPTIFDLVAPENFVYYSFGKSMFDSDKKYGLGFDKIINNTTLYHLQKDLPTESINLSTLEESKIEKAEYAEEHNDLMRLSWHYIVRGDSLASGK